MKYPLSNALVVRKVERTLRDSAYSDLKWAIEKLGVSHLWQCTTSPLEITNKETGQKILFRGLDSPFKITSISVPHGVLNYLWIEEAYEIIKEDEFDTIDESIRGELPEGYFQRITITFNPWSELHWLKRRFFDIPQDNVLAMTTTYKCNEFLSKTDIEKYEDIRRRSPARARVACDGEWGIDEGLVFENWRVEDLSEKIPTFDKIHGGMDFGYAADPNALIKVHHDSKRKEIYVFGEHYQAGMTDEELLRVCKEFFGGSMYVTCDSAEPKTIDYLAAHGIQAIGAVKGADSILRGIRWLQGYDIIIDPKCVNFIKEISLYAWDKDKSGNIMAKPIDAFNHCLTGDTVVHTTDGNIPIKELVGKSGKVHCYDEINKKATISTFYDCRMTQENAEIYEITLADGSTIKATGEHPVLTKRGWVCTKNLTCQDEIVKIY